ncbi:MAG: ATP synthase F1 subunit epsilon [Deltaproteobacteria bacterium]|nr:MAG: ATP synthase F1 subunit epsilon [Deltaproteobacteria bacterium]
MADKLSLEVVTPEKIVLSEDNAEMVISPGELGDFGVLKGHTPFLTSLRMGVLRFINKDNQEKAVFIKGGFAEALPDKVTILADAAENSDEIDLDRAQKAKERALERLENVASDEQIDSKRAHKALQRAEIRIKLALV